MEHKFSNYLGWIILGIVSLVLLALILEPIIWWTQYSEIRLYIRLFLIMFALNTFAILRLYNSIVQNTRFSIKLREVSTKLQQSLPALDRVIKTLIATLNGTKSSVESLRKDVADNTDKVERLTEKIKKH